MQRRNNKQVFARLFARVCWPAITRVNFRFSEKTARKFSSGRATHCTSRYTYLVWHSRRIAEIKLTVQCKACSALAGTTRIHRDVQASLALALHASSRVVL